MRRRGRISLGCQFGLFVGIALGIASCGSETNNTTVTAACGTGTVLDTSTNTCVAADAGSGGSAGGNGGAAGTSGNAGSGGSAGSAGLGGAAGQDSGLVDSAVDAADSSIFDALVDGEAGPGDDPCPTQGMLMNCSDSCGAKTKDLCALALCSTWEDQVKITKTSQFPVVIRTPTKPGVLQTCKDNCTLDGSAGWAASFLVTLHLAQTTYDAGNCGFGIRVSVGAPWRVLFYGEQNAEFCNKAKSSDCVYSTCDTANSILIVTDDPNAPARNVTIEHLSNPVSCK